MAKRKTARKKSAKQVRQVKGPLPRDPEPAAVRAAEVRATSLPPKPLPAYEAPETKAYEMPAPDEPHNPVIDDSFKYDFGKNYSCPTTITNSGVLRLVSRERGESNRFIGGHGWVYNAVAMPSAKSNDEPSGALRFQVRESEMDSWGSQVVGP